MENEHKADSGEQPLQALILSLNERLQANPQNGAALFERAQIYSSLKNYPEALRDVSAAISVQRKWVEAWVLRAETFAFLKDYEAAFVNYEVALKLDLRRAATYWSRARLYEYLALTTVQGRSNPAYREKNGRAALADYGMAFRLEPQSRNYIRARARLGKEIGEYIQAIADYNHWLELEPTSLLAIADRADICARLGQNEQAITDYSYLIEHKPIGSLYQKRGFVYKAQGEYRLALLDLASALQLNPATHQQRLTLHQTRADIFRQIGRNDKTIEELKQIVPLEEALFGSSVLTREKIRKLEPHSDTGSLYSSVQ